MAADAFDKLICSLEGYDLTDKTAEQVLVHVIKRLKALRRKEYTLMIANAVDHVTAYELIKESGSVEALRDRANDDLRRLMEEKIPFVGCYFRLLSFVDWDMLKKVLEQRAQVYEDSINTKG